MKKKHAIVVNLVLLALASFFCAYLVWSNHPSLMGQFFDELFHQYALSIRTPIMTQVMTWLSWWGVWGTMAIWVIICLVFLYRRQWSLLIFSIWLSSGGYILENGLKLLANRPRPIDQLLTNEFSRSFPSGHALNSIILYVTLSYFCYRFSRRFWPSFTVFVVGMGLGLAIGASRLYLGIHFFTDVIGGYFIGLGFFLFSLVAYKKLH